MNLNPKLISCFKKMNHGCDIKYKAIKLRKNNIVENLQDLGLGK